MTLQPDFLALLNYRTAEEGGRSWPAFSGYRPTIKFPFSNMQTSGIQIFLDCEKVNPGETVKAEIKILSTEYFKGELYENLEFEFCEGPNIIGTGKILQIFNSSLSASR